MSNIRKSMVGLLLLGLAVTAIGAGTFASFSASTTNSATFQTGTLVLGNQKQSASLCTSAGLSGDTDTDVNDQACDAIASGLTNLKPGDSTGTAFNVALTNVGTLTPSAFKWASLCTPGDNALTPYGGTGNPCTAIEVYIQEYDATFTTPTSSCFFPTGGSACNTSWSASSDALSDLPSTATTISGGLPKYYKIATRFLESGNQNSLQGRKADLTITWSLVQ